MKLFPSAANGRDEVGRLEDPQMLSDRLSGHREVGAELRERLAVAVAQGVEELPPRRARQGLEDRVRVHRPERICK